MRPLSPSHLHVSVNVYKQTTPEIPEVTCHETHYYGFFFARDVSDMDYHPGGEIMASLLPVGTHMQKLAY